MRTASPCPATSSRPTRSRTRSSGYRSSAAGKTTRRRAGDTDQYGGLTVQQKLERADELLKRWEGTDRYDEFKKRVDEMHAKYGQPAQQPAQQPGTPYLQKAEKATPWVKQGIYTFYNIAVGGGGTDMGVSQALDAVHDTYQSASQSVIRAGRDKIAKFVADAGKQAVAGVGEGTLKEAGFAREVAADLGRKGDLVLKQGGESATEQAANLYKGANDMKKTASGLEETARTAKAAASRQARVKAMNHVIDTGYQQTLKTVARKAGVKAATKAGVQLGAKAVASSVGPAAIAAGAVESAVRQGADLADTMKNTGATWSDVGKATGDVFTTKQGWKNLGWGLLGSLKDVASSVTFGTVDNGDKLRERMMDAKGGKASKLSEEQRVAHVNAGIAKHPGFSKEDIEDMRKSAAFVADPKNAIRGLLVEGTLKHDAERPVFYSQNDWEGGQRGFQGDRFSIASSLDDGRVVVFPSIYADKDGVTRLHTGRDAFDHYQKTGEHFGIYDSVENANRAAEWSHHSGNAGWLKRREKQQDAKGGEARGRYPGKLNNPGNVEKRAKRRRGEVDSPHDRWSKFATPQDGLREMADAIRQIADVKLAEKDQPFTIRNFAETYAPRFNEKGEPENDTDKYIRDISSTSGIDADAILDRWNTDDMAKLLKTVVRFESGVPHSRWFTDDEYRTAARELEEGATD